MPKMIRIEKTIIDKITTISADLPVKEPSDYPLRESIELLLPVIENLQKKGYSVEEISKIYTQNGLSISATTLRQYLNDFNKKSRTDKQKTSKPSKSKNSNSATEEITSTDSITELSQAEQAPVSENKPRPIAKAGFNLANLN
jgi:hypothetical protein